MKTVKVAMIQLNNYYEDQMLGYKEATTLIESACLQGIDMAILPELSGCGYIPNKSIWNYAEPTDGYTSKWACELSSKLGIYIGAGFIEMDGEDFFNSYILSNPKGEVSGIIRKEDAESYCFKRDEGSLYIDTDIGRIGVGICIDNHYTERLYRMKSADIDFMMMPHASPSPNKDSSGISEKDFKIFKEQPYTIASAYSNYLRVPSIYVNAVGGFPKFSGGFAVKSFDKNFCLMGGSLATDSDGELVSKMDNSQGYKIAKISLEKSLKQSKKPKVYHKKWLHEGSALYRYLMIPRLIKKGIKSYNKERLIFMKTFLKEHKNNGTKES